MFGVVLFVYLAKPCFSGCLGLNATFDWGTTKLNNQVKIAGAIATIGTSPYQCVQFSPPNSYQISYNLISGRPIVQNSIPYNYRADSPQELRANISFTQNNPSSDFGAILRAYFLRKTDNSTVVWQYNYASSPLYVCLGTYNRMTTMNNSSYQLFVNTPTHYCIQHPPVPTSFTGILNINQFTEHFIAEGLLQKTDYLQSVNYEYMIETSGGKLTANSFTYKFTSQEQLTVDGVITASGWSIFLQYFARNWSSLDYNNITLASGSTSLAGALVDFRFMDSPPTLLQAYNYIALGYLNNTWITPAGTYSLPISVLANLTVSVNFSFTQSDSVSPTRKAACIVLILRSDYNKLLNTFGTATTPSVEILICPWWSPSLTKSGAALGTRIYGSSTYDLFQQNAASNTAFWPTFKFISQTNSLINNNLEVLQFAKTLYNQSRIVNHSVAGIQAGFRLYSGKGQFTFQDFNICVLNISAKPPAPAPTPIQPNSGHNMSIPCPFTPYDSSEGECLQSTLGTYSFSNLLSIPTVGLVMRLSTVIAFVDDFSYYQYHEVHYDRSYSSFVYLCWNWTNSRWIPPFLQLESVQLQRLLAYAKVEGRDSPIRFSRNDEDIFLINNTQDYWFFTVPVATLLFLLLNLAVRQARRPTIRRALQPFSSYSFLLSNLLVDNIQYLSFRSVSQIYLFAPVVGLLSYGNLVLTVLTLFLVIIAASALPLLVRAWDCKFSDLMFRKCLRSTVLVIALSMLKIVFGFVHSYIEQSIEQVPLLLGLNGAIFVLIARHHSLFKLKTVFTLAIIIHVLKICLHLFLTMESANYALFIQNATNEAFFCQVSFMLTVMLSLFMGTQYVILFITDLHISCGKLKKPKKIIKCTFITKTPKKVVSVPVPTTGNTNRKINLNIVIEDSSPNKTCKVIKICKNSGPDKQVWKRIKLDDRPSK